MGYALNLLAINQNILSKVVEELNDVFGEQSVRVFRSTQKCLGDSERPCTVEDLKQLEYTERVIKESLRLYPAVPIFARKLQNDLQTRTSRILLVQLAFTLHFSVWHSTSRLHCHDITCVYPSR